MQAFHIVYFPASASFPLVPVELGLFIVDCTSWKLAPAGGIDLLDF